MPISPRKTASTPSLCDEALRVMLTYGPDVDWYRNVLAAGHCTLFWHRKVYTLEKPEALDAQTALSMYPFPQKLILRMLGTRHFARMIVQQPERASEPVGGR